MYCLTLTVEDMQAINWIGARYEHGDELYHFLTGCEWEPDDVDWGERDITFLLPEHKAWELAEKYRDCEFACTPDLGAKILEFIATIV